MITKCQHPLAYLSWLEDCPWFGDFFACFQHDFPFVVSIKDLEKVIVGSSHDVLIVSVEATFKLVEYKVVLVETAQLGSKILVNVIRFNRT